MAKYLVKVMLEYNAEVVVEATDVYEANELAKAQIVEEFVVYNSEQEEYTSWDYITAYDPEEVE